MIKADVIPALAILGRVADLECKRYAVMTLGNLAANTETRMAATRSEYSAFVLANICSNPDYVKMVGRQAALRRLADAPENWSILIDSDILTNLAS
eukprot:gene55226-73771_t